MGFCIESQLEPSLEHCPRVEYIGNSGIRLIKYWLKVSQ